MNIQARIVSRKIIMTYLYEKYIADFTAQSPSIMKEVQEVELQTSVLEQGETSTTENTQALLAAQYPSDDFDADITYLIQHCFDKQAERGIDMEYIRVMAPAFSMYAGEISTLVNAHTTTFQYDDMDIIDRVIFLLGYAEYMLMKTPKEVVMNEMIELAKKYGDEGSSKLINAILHKVLGGDTKKAMVSDDNQAEDIPESAQK
jgi:transcription antitermination protein NusB